MVKTLPDEPSLCDQLVEDAISIIPKISMFSGEADAGSDLLETCGGIENFGAFVGQMQDALKERIGIGFVAPEKIASIIFEVRENETIGDYVEKFTDAWLNEKNYR